MEQCFPFLQNQNISRTKKVILTYPPLFSASKFVFAVSVFACNIALIYGLYRNFKKWHLSQKLYVYLSMTDSILTLTLFYFGTTEMQQTKTCFEETLGIAVSTYSIGNSIGTFMTISFIRNFAIRNPLKKVV